MASVAECVARNVDARPTLSNALSQAPKLSRADSQTAPTRRQAANSLRALAWANVFKLKPFAQLRLRSRLQLPLKLRLRLQLRLRPSSASTRSNSRKLSPQTGRVSELNAAQASRQGAPSLRMERAPYLWAHCNTADQSKTERNGNGTKGNETEQTETKLSETKPFEAIRNVT